MDIEKNQKLIIRFMTDVNIQSITNFINLVETEFKNGVKFFRFLISSPGGMVDPGLSAFNYLKGLPVYIETVNFGAVDSISVMLFCAGKNRICVPNARFILHDVMRLIPPQSQPSMVSEIQLKEWIDALKVDRRNIAKVISDTTRKPIEEIEQLIIKGKVLNAEEAYEMGLVTAISENIIEEGVKIISI
jgi:ATP-dependent protease ClpP protease subunit